MKKLLSIPSFSSFFSRRRLHHHGFTLIEILVSISIVAITLTTVYGVFSSVSAAKNRLEQDSETYHKARVIFDRFNHELHGAYLSSGNKDTTLKGQKDSLENFSFELSTTAASPLSSTGTGFALVTYTITDDSEADDDSKVLLRTEKPLLSEDASSTVRTMRLASGIDYFNMRFYDGDSWFDSWDSSSKGLPDIVEIEIRINAGQGDPVPFLSAIRLPEMSR